jgi:hypothetical protein
MVSSRVIKEIKQKYGRVQAELDERGRRIWAATEALALGHGGVVAISRATGLGRNTIQRGCKELKTTRRHSAVVSFRRIRRAGAGRRPLIDIDADLLGALEAMVEPTTRGDPMSPLRWTCKSTRHLAETLSKQGHPVSHTKVAQLLEYLEYSLQGNRKVKEGESHADRDAQFEYINKLAKRFQKRGQPVISVDTKKKELIGDFANKGREYHPKGQPEKVRTKDFIDKKLGKGIPYGVYDLFANAGWVSVGKDHDTAAFAVQTIGQWWKQMGRKVYPKARELLIVADGGGSNGSRNRLWKVELQGLADELRQTIHVCHYPPGTSKWNKIEHRMFNHITQNWRGRPLVSHEVMVNLIASTTTKQGLKIRARLDQRKYPTGIKVTDEQMNELNMKLADFHGKDWNYSIKPRQYT